MSPCISWQSINVVQMSNTGGTAVEKSSVQWLIEAYMETLLTKEIKAIILFFLNKGLENGRNL